MKTLSLNKEQQKELVVDTIKGGLKLIGKAAIICGIGAISYYAGNVIGYVQCLDEVAGAFPNMKEDLIKVFCSGE